MLITPEYLKEQQRLHAKGGFGVSASKWAPIVRKTAVRLECESILDYGCGTGQLAKFMAEPSLTTPEIIPVVEYDPAIPGKNELVKRCDMTVCIDVLEHIEPECIDDVLDSIAKCTDKYLFAVVATRLSENKFLSDGRNAHILLQHGGWWEMKLYGVGFKVIDYMTKVTVHGLTYRPIDEWRCLAEKRKPWAAPVVEEVTQETEIQKITAAMNNPPSQIRGRRWKR